MVNETKKMEVEAICGPFELDQVLDGFTVENINLVAFTHAAKNIDIVVSNTFYPFSGVRILFLVKVCTDLWEKVDAVLNLEHLSTLLFFITHFTEFVFWEHGSIMLSYLEDRLVHGSNALLFREMRRRPLIHVE